MEKRGFFTEFLAISGTVFSALPLLAPIVLGLIAYFDRHRYLFDWLMPAELFPLVLLGGGLLVWAALRARSRRAWVGWSLGLAVAFLIGGQALAMVTGLASGEIEPEGIWWILVLVSLALYTLGVVSLVVNGILLMRDVFRRTAA
jgi:hypothetical protein